MRQIKILDCTLRDGGYYNNWQFSVQKANKYLKKIYSAGIDVVEVGFNFFKHNKFLDPIKKTILKQVSKSEFLTSLSKRISDKGLYYLTDIK